MLIKEYRIPLPMTVEEYRIAQLYMIAKKSREETKVRADLRFLKKHLNPHYSRSSRLSCCLFTRDDPCCFTT